MGLREEKIHKVRVGERGGKRGLSTGKEISKEGKRRNNLKGEF